MAIELFDTHCHVHEIETRLTAVHAKWFSDKAERSAETVLAGAHEAGVTRMIVIGTTLASPREAQIRLLRFQIELALNHDLPLSFHVREAFDDFWPVYESYKKVRGVLHSYTDNKQNMAKALSHDLYIGVNGIATFAKNETQHVIYRTIPQRSLLLETDAPFLTPVPFRGKVCEPKHVRVTAEYLAGLRGEALVDIAGYTTANAQQLFRI